MTACAAPARRAGQFPAATPAPSIEAKSPVSPPAVSSPAPSPAAAPDSQTSRLVIDLSARRVSLYQGNQRLNSYPIAIGRDGWETPTGQFQVLDMRENPTWINPFTGSVIPSRHPKNPLGAYWIGFWTDGKNWIGFHGTPDPESIGQAVSHGCVRMHNQDIEELYDRVSLGTQVVVQP